jgi:GxxExxY protein
MAIELKIRGLKVEEEVAIPVFYKEHDIGIGFRADLRVEDCGVLQTSQVS